MSTGYTYVITEGASFEDFVWRCARGMGALIMMRDESMDAKIPLRFVPSDYHADAVKAAQDDLAALTALSREDAGERMAEERKKAVKNAKRLNAADENEQELFNRMKSLVRDWTPPTPDHAGLKSFMMQQLNLTTEQSAYVHSVPALKPLSQWRAEKFKTLTESIEYHERELSLEIERTDGRNEWLRQLRESVADPGPFKATEDAS